MAKDKLVEYDSVANNNTVVGDVNLAENSMNPSDVNNALREIMSHQKEAFGSGTPLYVDQTNNRVGIDTTSPNSRLTSASTDGSTGLSIHRTFSGNVSGETTTGGLDFTLTDTATSNQVVSRISPVGSAGTGDAFAGAMRFYTAGTNGSIAERMRIDSSGNVAIGGTSASGLLHLHSSSTALMFIQSGNSSVAGLILGDTADSAVGGIVYDNNTDKLSLRGSNNDDRLTIDASGNVGIGTSSPTGKLTVDGGFLQVDVSGTQAIRVGSTDHIVGGTDNDAVLQSNTGKNMRFLTGGSERMRIDSSGTLLHSATSALNMGANDVEGFSLLAGGVLRISCDGNNALHVGRINSEGRAVRFACTGTSNVGNIMVTNSSTSYVTSSDYRLKENISYDFDATTRLKQLKPCRFNFIANTDKTVDGFLAHEVSSIVPEAIFGEKDAIDEDGNIDPQNIEQQKLVPLLVKTIQELEARITALEGA